MLTRIAVVALCLGGMLASAYARDAIGRAAHAWVAEVVERVQGTAASVAAISGTRKVWAIDVHVRVAADGTVLEVAFATLPPMGDTEERLRAAIVAAGPFVPPPKGLLAPNGTTSLDFPLRIVDGR